MDTPLVRALIAELIGTFALVFVGAGAGALGLGGLVGVALAHGLVLVAFVYNYGHVSGTHINPAVTLAVWASGKMSATRAAAYIVAQLLGGLVAACLLALALGGTETGLGATLLAGDLQVGSHTITVTAGAGVIVEALLTFLLATTVLQAAVAGRGGELAGVAIGVVLAACILMGGPLTGASLNPARTLGPAVATGNFADLWVYFVGPGLGALLAAVVFRGAVERA